MRSQQEGHIQRRIPHGLTKLSDERREASTLVGGALVSHEEAAAICHCPVGAVKRRVNRGRARIAKLLSIESPQDLRPDRAIQAALSFGRQAWPRKDAPRALARTAVRPCPECMIMPMAGVRPFPTTTVTNEQE